MSSKITIISNDQFNPTAIRIETDKVNMTFELGDGESSDNGGGGGRITLFRNDLDKQITIFLPKSAIYAIREVFRNSY